MSHRQTRLTRAKVEELANKAGFICDDYGEIWGYEHDSIYPLALLIEEYINSLKENEE